MQPSENMKPRALLHQSAPSAMARAMSKAVRILPRTADPDPVAQAGADQRIMDEVQAFAHRHADMVHELHRRGPGAAFLAVHHDEIRRRPARQHRLADRQELDRLAEAEFHPDRLAAGQFAQLPDEGHQFERSRKGAVAGRRDAIPAHRHAANGGDFRRDLGRRQHAAMAGLGALAQLDLDHPDLRVFRRRGEMLRAKRRRRACGSRNSRSRSPRSRRRPVRHDRAKSRPRRCHGRSRPFSRRRSARGWRWRSGRRNSSRKCSAPRPNRAARNPGRRSGCGKARWPAGAG